MIFLCLGFLGGFRRKLSWEVFYAAINPRRMGHQLFADMLEQAQAADRLGYLGVTIQEHHPIKFDLLGEV